MTADAPFQVLSDEQYVYVFRQSIGRSHTDAVFARDAKGDAVTDLNGDPVPLVDETLLVDRFVLVGTALKLNREVRYRRSRSKFRPQGTRDTLGAQDMNNVPFFEATQELNFIRHLKQGRFSVLILPTQVADVQRWQIFTHNSQTQRIDAFNVERSPDGLFNPRGSQNYTCPDHPDYFDQNPGRCPLSSVTDATEDCPWELIPIAQQDGFAESALAFDGNQHVALKAQLHAASNWTFSTWVNPETPGVLYSEGNPDATLKIRIDDAGAVVVSAHHQNNGESQVSTPVGSVAFGDWNFVSVALEEATDETGTARIQVNDVVYPNRTVSRQNAKTARFAAFGRNVGSTRDGNQDAEALTGQLDEIRLWDRALSQDETKSHRAHRLVGNEPGLAGYWRFDEGAGRTVYDQTDNALYGRIQGSPNWVASSAPIGDHPGMRRTSFSFKDRTIAAGLSAELYYQQEFVSSGYDRQPKPSKQNARVLLATATTTADAQDNPIAVLDFAVTPTGKLAQVPDTLTLETISSGEVDLNVLADRAVVLQAGIPATRRDSGPAE